MICKGMRAPVKLINTHMYCITYINYYYTYTLFIMLWQMAKVIHVLVAYATT